MSDLVWTAVTIFTLYILLVLRLVFKKVLLHIVQSDDTQLCSELILAVLSDPSQWKASLLLLS